MKRHAIIPLETNEPPFVIEQPWAFFPSANLAKQLGDSITLPNASLCSDFLVSPTGEIIGACVYVSTEDLPDIKILFKNSDRRRVGFREAIAGLPERYQAYPETNWLEVTWKDATDAKLAEAQSSNVLWYMDKSSCNIHAMVLEGLDHIQSKEVDGHFNF
jgi:hypothetical protein